MTGSKKNIKVNKHKQIIVFCGVLVENTMILLSLRDESECQDAHLRWEFPGGKPEFNESPEECLVREFREETGFEIKVERLLPIVTSNRWKYDWGEQQTFCLMYKVSLVKQHKRIKDHHVADVKWFNLNEIKNLKTLPGVLDTLRLI